MFNILRKKYTYNYDISQIEIREDLSKEKDQMRKDIYGLYGNEESYISYEERDKVRDWARTLTQKEILSQDLSSLDKSACWCLYHELH